MNRLTIDRAKWLNGAFLGGKASYSALLHTPSGRMCCLGFYAEACGIEKAAMRDISTPDLLENDGAIDGLIPSEMEWLVVRDNDDHAGSSLVCASLIEVNDSTLITQEEREAQIAALFKSHGITVEFVGDPNTAQIGSIDSEIERLGNF